MHSVKQPEKNNIRGVGKSAHHSHSKYIPQMEREQGVMNLLLSHWSWILCSSYSMVIYGISRGNFNYVLLFFFFLPCSF